MRLTGPGVWGEPWATRRKRRILRPAIGLGMDFIDITRLVGAILLEQNDEWAVQRAR